MNPVRSAVRRLALVGALAAAPLGSAAVIGANPPALSLTAERIAQLPAAEQPEWAAYLARSEQRMRDDRAWVAADFRASGRTQPLLPPAGRDAASVPLAKPADWYAGPEARQIAAVVLSYQAPNGGWSKNISLNREPRQPGQRFMGNEISRFPSPGDFDAPRWPDWNYFTTLDNDATVTQIHFLARVATALGPEAGAPYRAADLRGLGYLFAAQYPNGGFPQVWPLEGGYHDAITFNDDAMTQALEVLESAASGAGDYAFVPEPVRARARAAVARGVDCILAAQIVAGGHATVWCQQHDPLTLAPESGRNYELPAATAAESARVLVFLMRLPQPSPAVVAAVGAGVAWLQRTAIYGYAYRRDTGGRRLVPAAGAGPIWARYYQIGTDRPIFGDRDKTIHDDVNELSAERRGGYQWYGGGAQEALTAFARWAPAHGLAGSLSQL
jgi:PelA/Pel-15E family pectate lyase